MPTADSDVAVRVHRTLFTDALDDPQLLQNLTPFFEKLLEARAEEERETNNRPANGTPATTSTWAFDLQWISLDFSDIDH